MSPVFSYITSLKRMLKVIMLPYHHFGHWTLSRLVIGMYALLMSILVSSPIIAGIVYQAYLIWTEMDSSAIAQILVNQSVTPDMGAIFLNHFWGVVLSGIGILIIGLIVAFFFTYATFLVSNVGRLYMHGEKLPIMKNYYFSWYRMKRFFSLMGWACWYVMIPVLWAVVVIIVALILHLSQIVQIDTVSPIILGSVSIFAVVIFGFFFLRAVLRYWFSMFFLFHEERLLTGKECCRASREFTFGKKWKMIGLILPFLVILSLCEWGISKIETSWEITRVYSQLELERTQLGAEFVNDHVFLASRITPFSQILPTVQTIQDAFVPKTDIVDPQYFEAIMPYLDTSEDDPYSVIYSAFFALISFFVLYGMSSVWYYGVFKELGGEEWMRDVR